MSWSSGENARRYADFARTHPTYRDTSRDLVDLARPAADATVVDLACGTGATTEAVLSVLDERGRVIAVDASPAMLAMARSSVRDDRVRWLHSPAERLAVGPVDVVVCNSAIWQTDIRLTVAAVRRALRPGGRLATTAGSHRPAVAGNDCPRPGCANSCATPDSRSTACTSAPGGPPWPNGRGCRCR